MNKLDELMKLRDSLFPTQEEPVSLPNPNLPDGGGEPEPEVDLNALAAKETPVLDAEDLKAEITKDVVNKEVSNPYTETKEQKTEKSIADIRKLDDSNTQPKIPAISEETKAPAKMDQLTSIQSELEKLKGSKGDSRRKDMLMGLAKGLINAMGHFQAANPNARIGTKAIKQGDMIDDQMFQKRYKQDLGELMDKVKMSQASTKDKELSDYRNRQLDLQEKSMDQRVTESAADRANKMAIAKAKESGESAGLTKGQEATDKEFGKDYADFTAGGGYSTIKANLGKLKDITEQLKGSELTGSLFEKFAPEAVADYKRGIFNEEAQAVKDTVEQVIQQSLRETLGAQFTEKEAARLIDRSFNRKLSPEKNIERLNATIQEIDSMASQREASGKYFEEHGTLKGFKAAENIGSSAQPSTQTPAQHNQASEAEKWAKENPNDPRAQKILQRLGK